MPKRHPAAKHVASAKAAMQKNHDEIMAHLTNIEQSLQGGQDQDQGPQGKVPAGPAAAGMSMPDGSSPLGGKAG